MPDYPMVHIFAALEFLRTRQERISRFSFYSSGDEVELFLNGKSLGKKQKQAFEYRFRWNEVRMNRVN